MENFFSAAWQAAEAAGSLIRETWQQVKQIHYKSTIDLVTTVDRQAEERIVQVLRKHFPGHSILAEEETTIAGSQSGYRWIIDPLDGTTNFAHAYPHFSVSLALEREGEIILGLVYDPLREECFKAAKGQGAFLNGKPIQTSRVAELDKALLATGFPYDRRERAALYLAFFKAFMVRIRGSGATALQPSTSATLPAAGWMDSGSSSFIPGTPRRVVSLSERPEEISPTFMGTNSPYGDKRLWHPMALFMSRCWTSLKHSLLVDNHSDHSTNTSNEHDPLTPP